MTKFLILVLVFTGFIGNAKTNNNCLPEIVISSSNNNGIVKTSKGKLIADNQSMILEIDLSKKTVIIELNDKYYYLDLYKIDKTQTVTNGATLDGKQIFTIKINPPTNEVETVIGDLIYTTYIS